MPPMRTQAELAATMSEYRAHTGLSMAKAAEAAGVTLRTWQRIEGGHAERSHLRVRARIEALLPAQPEASTPIVETIDNHQRNRRHTMPGQAHRHDLSTGLVKCQVITAHTLPAQAYAVLAELVNALEAANTKLVEMIGPEPD